MLKYAKSFAANCNPAQKGNNVKGEVKLFRHLTINNKVIAYRKETDFLFHYYQWGENYRKYVHSYRQCHKAQYLSGNSLRQNSYQDTTNEFSEGYYASIS